MADSKISQLTSWTPTWTDITNFVQSWLDKKTTFNNLPISTATQTAIDNKVDKVTWKWLSTNDYDNTEKAKVDWAVQTIVAGTNVTVSRVWNSVTINSTWWGGGWWAVDSVNWQTWIVVLDTDDISEGITNKYLSVTDKTDLTDGWDSILHYHASDRNRANHTWTQAMSTISDAWALATLNSVDEAQIVNHAVTNTKLANMNTNTVKGRLSWNGTPQDVAMADLPISTATQTALNWKVWTTWNETIAWVKTFSSSPIVPTPTTDMQAATKKYVDDNAWGGWSTQIRKMFAVGWTIWATWTNVANPQVVDGTYTLTRINLWYTTVGNGTLTVDVNKNGTTVCSTTKPSITSTNQISINSWTITTAWCVSWDIYTIDIDAVPWTPWVDLFVELVFTA